MRRGPAWGRGGPALAILALAVAVAVTGCSSATLNTTVLPPHRLEDPIRPLAVIVHEDPSDVPPGDS